MGISIAALGKHALFQTAWDSLSKAAHRVTRAAIDKGTERAGEVIMEKLSPQEALLESIIIPRLAMFPENIDNAWVREGLSRWEDFYQGVDEELQDRLERFRAAAWRAIADGIGKISFKEIKRVVDKKKGTETIVEVPDQKPTDMWSRYFAYLGHQGEAHIMSDLKKAEQASGFQRTLRRAGKSVDRAGHNLADLLEGINEGRKKR